MEIAPHVPAWVTWMTAGGVGLIAIAALARTLDTLLDLDRS